MVCLNTACTPKFFTVKFANLSRRVSAVIISITIGIPRLSDPSLRYSNNIHTDTRWNPTDSVGFPPSPSPCTPLLWLDLDVGLWKSPISMQYGVEIFGTGRVRPVWVWVSIIDYGPGSSNGRPALCTHF